MYPYIVVVAPVERIHDFNFRDRDLQPREWQAGLPEQYPPHPENLDINRPMNLTAHFMRDETSAKVHAQYLARLHPNQEVYITKTTGMTVAKPSVPSIMSVTEKGVLPE